MEIKWKRLVRSNTICDAEETKVNNYIFMQWGLVVVLVLMLNKVYKHYFLHIQVMLSYRYDWMKPPSECCVRNDFNVPWFHSHEGPQYSRQYNWIYEMIKSEVSTLWKLSREVSIWLIVRIVNLWTRFRKILRKICQSIDWKETDLCYMGNVVSVSQSRE